MTGGPHATPVELICGPHPPGPGTTPPIALLLLPPESLPSSSLLLLLPSPT